MVSRLLSKLSIVLVVCLVACLSNTLFAADITLGSSLDSTHAGISESSLSDLTADAVLTSASGAQLALVPAEETRPDSISSGSASADRIVQNLKASDDPSDTIVITHLTGEQIIAALNHGASRYPNSYDGYLQIAGIKVAYRKNSDGHEVVQSVRLDSGSELTLTATYSVAMPSYLAQGGLGYFAVWPSDMSQNDTGVTISGAVRSYLANHTNLSYQTGSRIARA